MVALMNRVYPIIMGLTAQSIGSLGYSSDGSGEFLALENRKTFE